MSAETIQRIAQRAEELYRDVSLPEVRAWYEALGQRILGAMRAAGALGGTVDLSAARAELQRALVRIRVAEHRRTEGRRPRR